MSTIIKKITFCLLLSTLLISCTNYNTKKINVISDLESITRQDYNLLNLFPILELRNNLKIAKLNLAKIEEKKIDSITMELIYFEYKAYINCVTAVYESTQEIDLLNKVLATNMTQLKNIKSDYQNSRSKREDLTPHLIEEGEIVHETSLRIQGLINQLDIQILEFDSLNAEIEVLIDL